MGENEGSAEAGRPLANGLLPGAGHVMTAVDTERWSRAEERTAELISCIQPNQVSEERRNAVAEYVQRLIMKCFPCQVCTFGSVPLKTYLPDGDIDLTAFSHDQNLKDTWANQVRDMLENEEKNENAEFHVKEVQYIQAEVKIIKCLVENIIVDISFNQVGGLCTLCFLDEVDSLIKQNHLFKRSIILIKAWCYYESRILGAHHGLISTYALETLVLYIFHVFNNSFHGPLEVLYRFLEFFSNFDWDNFCVSLWGPVPISSLPDGIAAPPRNDSGELLLSKLFLDACSSVYAVFPGGQENNGQPFVSKHFNVIDPLRVNNNLGRSVSKGNFFRIRSAFAFGAKKLARLLDCPKENLIFEVNQFFMNTWKRHGSGNRPDVPSVSSQHGKVSSRMMPPTNELSPFPHMQSSRSQNKNSLQSNDSSRRAIASAEVLQNDLKSDARFLFARTRSSPELTDAYGDGDVSSQVRRGRETKTTNRKKNLESESSLTSADVASDSNNGSSSYRQDSHLDSLSEEYSSAEVMHNEEQDLVNLMASASLQGFNRHLNGPFNLNTAHMPFSIPPSLIASMAYTHQNHPGFFPTNTPLIDPSFGNMQFPHGMVSPQFTHYFPGIERNSPSENSFDRSSENFGSAEMKSEELDNDFWPEQNVGPSYDSENGNTDIIQSEDKDKPPSISGLKYVPPPRMAASRGQQKHTREKRGSLRQNSSASPIHENRNSDAYSEERSVSSRFSSAAHSNSFRSRTSSESSWDGSSVKTPKSAKEKRGKKISLTNLGKGKSVSEHAPNQAEEDDQECVSLSNVGKELVESNSFSEPIAALQVPRVLIDHGSRQRIDDNSELIFYPTGPAIPFVAMLPLYNVPPETGTSDQSSSRFEGDETTQNNEGYNHSDDLNISSSSFRGTSGSGTSEDKKPDILNSDFLSHWQNLQFGRYCQNPRSHGPLLYPSPVMVPPAYLQGRFPYENTCRPFPTNKNIFSQLMTSYGQRVVPLAPIQSVSSRPAGPYQPYIDDMPRYRSGTGTYLPNHNQKIPNRDQHSSSTRRGSYNHDRSGDSYGEREGGNWNANSKPRASSSRSRQPNSRADHSASSDSRADRPWNTSSGENMAYSMYPLDPNGASSGPSGPPLMMLYPFDHNATYTPQGEQLEFGSLGPIGIKDQLPEHRHHRSSPDRPSSSHRQR